MLDREGFKHYRSPVISVRKTVIKMLPDLGITESITANYTSPVMLKATPVLRLRPALQKLQKNKGIYVSDYLEGLWG